jgi:pimeloyl-ACP methyl ester carboxylesterase
MWLAGAFGAGLLIMTGVAASPAEADINLTRCATVEIPVTIPGVTAPGQITGDYCQPSSTNGTVLLMVGGGGENADYWNMPGLPENSLVNAANARGYATLAIDRLGTGRSTLPTSSTSVTFAAQVSTVHQVVQALRGNPNLFGGASWTSVIGVGHSLGSGTLAGVAANNPGDLEALVLTGYGAAVTPQTLQLDKLYQVPASTVSPAWANLDSGYVTVIPSAVEDIGLLYPPGTSQDGFNAASTHQGTLSTTELATRPQGAAAIAQGALIHLPVFVADGQYDLHYCEANAVGDPVTFTPQCQSESAFYSYEQQLVPNACLSTQLIPTSGHAIQEEIAAPLANTEYLCWIDALLGKGTTC